MRPVEVFLDVETDRDRELRLVGLYSSGCGVVQVVDAEITRARLSRLLPKAGHLFTFNGAQCDIPAIRHALGLDLNQRFVSRDLRRQCRDCGLKGGQKFIDRRLGFRRDAEPPNVWQQWSYSDRYDARGDERALGIMKHYNELAIHCLRHIRRWLSSRRWVARLTRTTAW